MSEANKINADALEEVVGGAIRTVRNDNAKYANLRYEPGLDGEIAAKAYNGAEVRTTGGKVYKDGYVWYEVRLEGDYEYYWIAGSLIGY